MSRPLSPIKILSTLFLLLAFTTTSALAIECHCFTDREFVAAEPAKADPYLLATARNSLLAAAVNVEKGTIVKSRMNGTGETDLWVAHIVGGAGKATPNTILSKHEDGQTWAETFKKLGIDNVTPAKSILAIESGGDAEILHLLSDPYLVSALGLTKAEVETLHNLGADTGETALAGLLKTKTGAEPIETYRSIMAGQTTWGTLVNAMGLEPKQAGEMIMELVKNSK